MHSDILWQKNVSGIKLEFQLSALATLSKLNIISVEESEKGLYFLNALFWHHISNLDRKNVLLKLAYKLMTTASKMEI